MAYETFRVELTRDETRESGPVTIEITAYIDRVPETNEAAIGRLGWSWRGVWNSRVQYTGDFDTLVKLGNANFEAERYDVAERWYSEALAKKPDAVDVRSDLGLTYFLRKPPQPERAVAEFRRALEYDPEHVPTLHNLTLVLAKTGDLDGAEATFARLEKINPQNDNLAQLREELDKSRRGADS